MEVISLDCKITTPANLVNLEPRQKYTWYLVEVWNRDELKGRGGGLKDEPCGGDDCFLSVTSRDGWGWQIGHRGVRLYGIGGVRLVDMSGIGAGISVEQLIYSVPNRPPLLLASRTTTSSSKRLKTGSIKSTAICASCWIAFSGRSSDLGAGNGCRGSRRATGRCRRMSSLRKLKSIKHRVSAIAEGVVGREES
ncbi:uncharacterized protein EI90DRAFT_1089935 [Cantharellus anzutake]|uniref:uncharacterized protein n=1 Tax=Cantharellus anzutake TaxID=1750568 RepID=UPI001906BB67|nr:uncharacterized protein EI90DRAFT_1089935 [Cantharellus anzutake]KAF8330716.1 hypothetical protein EI90DRAFT_1089935 [Cantharellus anzutake]